MKYASILFTCSIGLAACVEGSDAVPPQSACDPAQIRFLAGDTWPVAGGVRRDEFTTSECVPVVLTRAAVAAPAGFKPGELYVVTRAEMGSGSHYTSAEFVGRTDSASYRYQFS